MVVKKSLWIDLRREIRRSLPRFLSILVMVGLGVMFLVGLRCAAPNMRRTADDFFDRQALFDLQLVSTLGLTSQDTEAFSALEGVEACEGGWIVDAMLGRHDAQKPVKVLSLSREFQRPILIEGRLPQAPDECAVDERLPFSFEAEIGDTVTLDTAEDDVLAGRTFTVTGFVQSPLYISIDRGTGSLGDGSIAGFVVLPEQSFAADYYTAVYLKAAGAEALDTYAEDYAARIDALRARAEPLLEERAELRYRTLMDDGRATLDDARRTLDEAWDEAQAKIADGEAELSDAAEALADGRAQLEDARADLDAQIAEGAQSLADARAELDAGWSALRTSKAQLDQAEAAFAAREASAEAELSAAEAELAQKTQALAEAEAALAEGASQAEALRQQAEDYAAALAAQTAQVEAAAAAGMSVDPASLPLNTEKLAMLQAAAQQAAAQVEAGQAELEAGKSALAQARAAIDAGKAELEAAAAQLAKGRADYAAGLQRLRQGEASYSDAEAEYERKCEEGRQQLADAEAELEEKEAEYRDGLAELADARQEADDARAEAQAEIDDGEAELAELKPPETYALDRNTNYGYVSYDQNATRMANLAKMFPVIFYLVAALVCLTTMTRMVEEQRTQIGAIKAMGYGTGAIAGKFLLYGVSAALLGAILGAAAGLTVIPWIIFSSYGIMYILPHLHLEVYWGLCLAAGGVGILCTVVATLWAMLSTARQTPAALMRPKAPKPGKRILLERIKPLWSRFCFSVKVSARNIFRYKKRFWMTVIGVAGCTGLLIAGLGLHRSIFDILDVQFYDLYRYDVQLTVDDGDEIADRVIRFLDQSDAVASYAGMNTRSVQFSANGTVVDGYLTVTNDPETLSRQIVLRDMDTKQPMKLPDSGALIDVKLAELLDVSPGDEITVDCGQRLTMEVAGVREHYVYHYATMTGPAFSALSGTECADNEYLITAADTSDEALSSLCESLMGIDGVRNASNLTAMARTFRKNMEVVNSAVMVIILSAAALAFVVLYNLTNINVTERIRELATIKVLGFYDPEVGMYIYRENMVLTVLGILLGQLFGKYLCGFLIRTIEMDIVMFGRETGTETYLLSVALSIGFALIVNFFTYFRIKRIDMVQSLKSVE